METDKNTYVVIIQAIQVVQAKNGGEARRLALKETEEHPEDLRAVNWSII